MQRSVFRCYLVLIGCIFSSIQPHSLVEQLSLYRQVVAEEELREKQLGPLRGDACSIEALKRLKGQKLSTSVLIYLLRLSTLLFFSPILLPPVAKKKLSGLGFHLTVPYMPDQSPISTTKKKNPIHMKSHFTTCRFKPPLDGTFKWHVGSCVSM